MGKLSTLSRVASLNEFRYGHDPSHYPIKSVAFVMSNPSLWRRVACVACFGMTVSFLALVFLLVFALKPQAEAFGGAQWWSWILAVLVVLLEAAVITLLVVAIAHSKCQTEVFVQTMKIKGKWREGEMKKQSLCKELNLFCKKAFIVRIITFPINIIPFVGAAIYSAINATFIGWDYMDMYFDAIKMPSNLQRVEIFGENRSDCASLFHCSTYDSDNDFARFGFMCSMLEMVPIVGTALFPLTNACAAALFACDIEEAGGPVAMRPPDWEPPVPVDEDQGASKLNKVKKVAASNADTAKKLYEISQAKGKTGKLKAIIAASTTSASTSGGGSNTDYSSNSDYVRHDS